MTNLSFSIGISFSIVFFSILSTATLSYGCISSFSTVYYTSIHSLNFLYSLYLNAYYLSWLSYPLLSIIPHVILLLFFSSVSVSTSVFSFLFPRFSLYPQWYCCLCLYSQTPSVSYPNILHTISSISFSARSGFPLPFILSLPHYSLYSKQHHFLLSFPVSFPVSLSQHPSYI